MDWIDLSQGRNRTLGVVNTLTNLRFLMRYGEIFGLDEELSGSQERTCSVKLTLEFVNQL